MANDTSSSAGGAEGEPRSAEATARAVRRQLDRAAGQMLEELAVLVDRDSPTANPALLSETARWLADRFASVGSVTTLAAAEGSAPHLVIEIGPVADGATPLVLCHYDTVWPEGTAARWPFTIDGNYASGPGVLDMKASIVMAKYAVSALRELGIALPHGLRVCVSADEEIGNPTSETLITDLARRSSAALVLEPPLADGRLKTSRKGYARIRFAVEGRAAHAGIEPESGVNAAVEAAHLAIFADRLNDAEAGTSVTVGVLGGGQRSNIVPASAGLEIDVRAETEPELQRVVETLRSRRPTLPRATARMTVDVLRAPMTRGPRTDALLASARRIGGALRITIAEGHTGGVSEGNITQAAGTPTLDGLGVIGVGPHTPEERILVRSLFDRCALLAGLLIELGGPDKWSADREICHDHEVNLHGG